METYDDGPDGTRGSLRNRVAARSTLAPPPAGAGSASTISTPKTPSIIPLAPGGTRFRRVLAWLGLSLPAWLVGMAVLSPVSLRCTSVSVPEGYDRGFAQLAVVCWAVFRDPGATTNVPSGGLTPKSDPPSPGSFPEDMVPLSGASWIWAEVMAR
jgi:hypothetical protein